MAITVPPGRHFNVYVIPANEMYLSEQRDLYSDYAEVYDGPLKDMWSIDEFRSLINKGHIHIGVIENEDDVQGRFALQLMLEPVVHLNFLFYIGNFHRSMFDTMFCLLWHGLQSFKEGIGSDKPGAVRLVGRKGWQRMLKVRGFEIDADGYIREDQKAVVDGYSKWHTKQ